MKYSIDIEGGFTGIPMHFEGEVALSHERAAQLLCAMESAGVEADAPWPDALTYRVKMEEGALLREAVFTDATLPKELRIFLDGVRQNRPPTDRSG